MYDSHPHRFFALLLYLTAVVCLGTVGCRCTEPPAPEIAAPEPITVERIRTAIDAPPPGGYDLLALRVGTAAKAKKRLFVAGAGTKQTVPIVFCFFAIVGAGRVILVDTGFTDPEKIRSWHVESYRRPDQVLAAAGLSAHQVTDVIVTHRHWDHIGGVSLFPNATIRMAKPEYHDAVKRYRSKNPALAQALTAAHESGRVKFTAPVQRLFPGITVVRQGRHTRHFQYVLVNKQDGLWVLASDEGPLLANYEGPLPSGQTGDAAASIEAIRNMLSLTGNRPDRILPGHAPEIFTRFPDIAQGVVRIGAARTSP